MVSAARGLLRSPSAGVLALAVAMLAVSYLAWQVGVRDPTAAPTTPRAPWWLRAVVVAVLVVAVALFLLTCGTRPARDGAGRA